MNVYNSTYSNSFGRHPGNQINTNHQKYDILCIKHAERVIMDYCVDITKRQLNHQALTLLSLHFLISEHFCEKHTMNSGIYINRYNSQFIFASYWTSLIVFFNFLVWVGWKDWWIGRWGKLKSKSQIFFNWNSQQELSIIWVLIFFKFWNRETNFKPH